MLIKLFIFKIKTIDGQVGTMEQVIEKIFENQSRGLIEQTMIQEYERRIRI